MEFEGGRQRGNKQKNVGRETQTHHSFIRRTKQLMCFGWHLSAFADTKQHSNYSTDELPWRASSEPREQAELQWHDQRV